MFMIAALISCGASKATKRSQSPNNTSPEFSAPANVSESFIVKKISLDTDSKTDGANEFELGLSKDSLFRANAVQGISTPSFSGLKTRVVAFKKQGSSLLTTIQEISAK